MALSLDARQRAMLHDMGITPWWPAVAAEPAPTAAPAAVTGTATPVAPIAIDSEANFSIPTRAVPPNLSQGTDTDARRGPSTRPPVAAPLATPVSAPARAPTPALAPLAAANHVASLGWTELQSTVASCQRCGLCASRTQTVFGVGQAPASPEATPRVDWLIVGEAPGENEDLQGEPFVGAAGKLLDNMLAAMKLSRHHNVYIANVLKCRPPGNRNPAPDESAACAPYLHRQIELLNPQVILAMGRFAINTLLADTVPDVGAQPVGRLRGQVHDYRGKPVIVTYHPAYLLRNLPEKAKAWADLCLAMAVRERVGG